MIAARGDLNKVNGSYPFSSLEHANLGALDSKITSRALILNDLKMRVISSPPYEDVPVFDWLTVKHMNVSHMGLPDRWEFNWFEVGS